MRESRRDSGERSTMRTMRVGVALGVIGGGEREGKGVGRGVEGKEIGMRGSGVISHGI